MRMDNSKLIGYVFQRKQLWDVGDQNYHNRDLSRKLWNEIANEMQCTSHVAKSKWQNLRDTYRKEYMKLLRTGGDLKSSHWKYFDKLKFLNDVIVLRRKTSGKRWDDDADDTKPTVDGFEEYTEFTDITPLRYLCEVPQVVEGETDNGPTGFMIGDAVSMVTTDEDERGRAADGGKRHSSQNVQPFGVQNDREHRAKDRRAMNVDVDRLDEDYHFVMSILPHLRDVPKRRKLIVRQKLQQILLEEQTQSATHRRTAGHHVCNGLVKSETISDYETEFTEQTLGGAEKGLTSKNTKETDNVEDK